MNYKSQLKAMILLLNCLNFKRDIVSKNLKITSNDDINFLAVESFKLKQESLNKKSELENSLKEFENIDLEDTKLINKVFSKYEEIFELNDFISVYQVLKQKCSNIKDSNIKNEIFENLSNWIKKFESKLNGRKINKLSIFQEVIESKKNKNEWKIDFKNYFKLYFEYMNYKFTENVFSGFN